MAEEVLGLWDSKIEKVEIVPSYGGIFNVDVDGETVFSKHEAGRFPEEGEVGKAVGEKLAPEQEG